MQCGAMVEIMRAVLHYHFSDIPNFSWITYQCGCGFRSLSPHDVKLKQTDW